MKKRVIGMTVTIGMCLFLSGCNAGEVNVENWMEKHNITVTLEPTEDDINVSVTPEETQKPTVTAIPAISEEPEDGVFYGENFQFYEVSHELFFSDPSLARYKIHSVYEGLIEYDNGYHGLFVGQVVTMFGDENVTIDHEALLSYVVAAEDASGEVIYLEVYYGPSGPSIGGSEGENYTQAAKELEDIIRSIKPMDYECECIYFDTIDIGGGRTRMGTKDGKGFYQAYIDGVWY